ncbi:MAG: helix-turn-helix transcriptional regulator, partial [Tissierellia bacterium]|nr:helix-turn-helix transcriptional regulator [Tissierellia bacterium]
VDWNENIEQKSDLKEIALSDANIFDNYRFYKIKDFLTFFSQKGIPELLDYFNYRKWFINDTTDRKKMNIIDDMDYFFRIDKFMRINYKFNFKLKDIAKEFFLSERKVSAIIRKNTGKKFNEFNDEVKLEQVKMLLLNTDYKISKIARKLGFKNPSTLYRKFSKSENITMLQYRKKHKDIWLANISGD